jgi:hypothetical protein
MKIGSEMQNQKGGREEAQLAAAEARKREDLQAHPEVVLTLLEPDQVVVAKQRTHFGPRRLTRRHKVLLWGLRIYVVAMLIIVLVSVIRAVHVAH